MTAWIREFDFCNLAFSSGDFLTGFNLGEVQLPDASPLKTTKIHVE
jgi:hypothetical protein